MKLEKKFTVDLLNPKDLVSKSSDAFFSDVFKVHDDNGEVYCGKFPKIKNFNYLLLTSNFKKFEGSLKIYNLNKFSDCFFYENKIAKDIWNRFGLAMKPEGVYDVKIKGTKDFYVPAFVNELAINMDPRKLEFSEYKIFEKAKNYAFEVVLKEGYYMYHDADWDKNCFYSSYKGFKFNDFGLWGKEGKFNHHIKGSKNFYEGALIFAKEKKKELGLI